MTPWQIALKNLETLASQPKPKACEVCGAAPVARKYCNEACARIADINRTTRTTRLHVKE